MVADLKPYPEYQESGLPWLGQVPKCWEIKRAKSLFQRIDERSTTGSEELLTVSSARGIVPRKTANVTMFKAESYLGYKLCWPDDLVINSLWAWAGGLGVSRHHGIISSAYGVYRIRPDAPMIPAFVHEVVRSSSFNWELRVRSKGVWISRLQLTDISFLDAPIHIPPPAEQVAIVRFLCWANGRLEQAILAKRKVIALLNEQKQAIIHRAVTRGLDPSVPLKPSGILWLGDISQHCQGLQLRRLVSLVTSGSRGWANYYSDEGLIFLQSGNLGRSMALNLSSIQHVRPPRGAEGERTRVTRNDILICITGALTGNVAIVDQDLPAPTFVNQHVALVRPRQEMIEPRFLAYVLYSKVGRMQFKTNEYGGTKQGLGLGDVKSVFVPVPSLPQQRAISADLDTQVAGFQETILRLEREIVLLREYRTRLVADVVTGKLDVREAATQLPDVAAPSILEDDAELSIDPEAADEEVQV
jgi:type I restriction enzyme S subunit